MTPLSRLASRCSRTMCTVEHRLNLIRKILIHKLAGDD